MWFYIFNHKTWSHYHVEIFSYDNTKHYLTNKKYWFESDDFCSLKASCNYIFQTFNVLKTQLEIT